MSNHDKNLIDAVNEMEKAERNVCNLSLIFAETIKDEINANDETRLYNGVKRLLGKYSGDHRAMAAIDEFTSVLSGGASLEEIINVALDEAAAPTAATDITVDTDCDRQ